MVRYVEKTRSQSRFAEIRTTYPSFEQGSEVERRKDILSLPPFLPSVHKTRLGYLVEPGVPIKFNILRSQKREHV